jgi:short-subunit dehydrogenase
VEIKTHSCDFEKLRTPVQYVELLSNFSNLDISILVNNVGFYNPRPFL